MISLDCFVLCASMYTTGLCPQQLSEKGYSFARSVEYTLSRTTTIQHKLDVLNILGRSPAAAANQTRTSSAELQGRLADRLAGLVARPHVLPGDVRLARVRIAQQRQARKAAHVLQRLERSLRRDAVDAEGEGLLAVLRN